MCLISLDLVLDAVRTQKLNSAQEGGEAEVNKRIRTRASCRSKYDEFIQVGC